MNKNRIYFLNSPVEDNSLGDLGPVILSARPISQDCYVDNGGGGCPSRRGGIEM